MASRRQQLSQATKHLKTFNAKNGSAVRGWTEDGDTKVTIITTGPVRWTRFGSDQARVYPSDCVFPVEVKVPKDVDHVVYQDDGDDGDDNEDTPHGLGMGKTVGEDGYQRWKSVPSLNSNCNKAETPPLPVPKSWKATLTAMQAFKQASEPSRTGHYVL